MRSWLRDGEVSAGDREPYAVSHLGWGLNPQARWDSIALYGDMPERSRAAARTFPGNFLFSTGPNTQGGGKRKTRGHYDVPMRNCTIALDGRVIIEEAISDSRPTDARSPGAPMTARPPAAYPAQEPFSEVARAYHDRVMELGREVHEGEVLPYGPDPYQQVLLYPAALSPGAVLAFMHGGGWTNGYKEWMSFLAPAVTRAGISFASLGYRLAPAHLFPTGLQDCADALRVIKDRTPSSALFVGGHSAGGHYAAWLAVRNTWWKERSFTANPIRGCLPVSGTYFFGEGSGLSMRPRFLGPGPTERAASPIHEISDRTPFLLA